MDTMIKYAFYAYLINEELGMRSEELRCQLSLTDLKPLRHSYAVPPLLKRRGLNLKIDFRAKLKLTLDFKKYICYNLQC